MSGDGDGDTLLGRGHVPQRELRIKLLWLVKKTHRDQGLAVRRETYGPQPKIMSRHAGPLLGGGQIPKLHRSGLLLFVDHAHRQGFTVRREGEGGEGGTDA